MDTPNLLIPLVAGLLLIVMPRLILQSVGRASEGIAQLFVPPDRALGWPIGVQESDEPWGWHGAPRARRGRDAAESPGPAVLVELPAVPNELAEIVDLPTEGRPVRDGLIVSVHAVRPRGRT